MSRRSEARQRTTAATYPCTTPGCGSVADYRCELRRLEPKRKVKVAGVTKIVEPYAVEYLCSPCCATSVASDDPPRLVEPLKHKAIQLAAEAKAERARVDADRRGTAGSLLDGMGGGLVTVQARADVGVLVLAGLFAAFLVMAASFITSDSASIAPVPGDITPATAAPAVLFNGGH